MSDNESVLYENRGGAAWITLNAPERRNALSGEMVQRAIALLEDAHADPGVRAIVFTGNGSAFCAGADLKNRGSMGEPGERGGNPFVDLMLLLREGPKPVICAVNGAAFGGGLGLIASCDIAVAIEGAKFSFSEVRIGVVPAMISVVVLPKIGEHNTMRLFLTGERFTSDKALEYGLIHRVVPADELKQAVDAEVSAISQGGPNAIREAKKLVRTVAKLDQDEGFAYAEGIIEGLFQSDEAAEGMAAFAEKRPPKWVQKD
jgi:methylglutaconyl-CoA hydratase